jgi:TrpR-related protein YerC/YecD
MNRRKKNPPKEPSLASKSAKKKSRVRSQDDYEALYDALLKLENGEEVRKFLSDLLTPVELQEICERYKAARMLSRGSSYVEIIAATGLSSTTVARVASWVKKGTGGYKLVLERSGDPK